MRFLHKEILLNIKPIKRADVFNFFMGFLKIIIECGFKV